MGSVKANTKIKKATISAVVTRKDGTVENKGIISHYDRNPLKRALFKLKQVAKKASAKIVKFLTTK